MVSSCGNKTITGWMRKAGGESSRRLNVGQKSWFAVRWTIDHYCGPEEGVIDVTCGTGTSGDVAVRTGRHFLGLDICPDAIEACKERLAAALNQERGRLYSAGILDAPSDLDQVSAMESLKNAMEAEDDKTTSQEDVDLAMKKIKECLESGFMEEREMPAPADLERWLTAAAAFFKHSSHSATARFLARSKASVMVWIQEQCSLVRMVNAVRERRQLGRDLPSDACVSSTLWELEHAEEPAAG